MAKNAHDNMVKTVFCVNATTLKAHAICVLGNIFII